MSTDERIFAVAVCALLFWIGRQLTEIATLIEQVITLWGLGDKKFQACYEFVVKIYMEVQDLRRNMEKPDRKT